MVITHEPTFWLGNDDVRGFAADALYQKKLQFIREHNMVVWRFHDHLHARQPDMSAVGLAEALGWDKYGSRDEARVYVLPSVRLRDLARDIARRLKVPAIRVNSFISEVPVEWIPAGDPFWRP